jgi:hypothetical protein
MPGDKSDALFYMGQIAFDEGYLSVELKDWVKTRKWLCKIIGKKSADQPSFYSETTKARLEKIEY